MSDLNLTSALDRMLEERRELDVPRLGKVYIRPLPFTTLVHLIMELFTVTRGDSKDIRASISGGLEELSNKGQAVTVADMMRVLDLIMPLLFRVVSSSPAAMERFLTDVVVGIKKEHVAVFPVEAALFVVAESAEGVDKGAVVAQLKRTFTQAADVWQRLAAQRTAALEAAPAPTLS